MKLSLIVQVYALSSEKMLNNLQSYYLTSKEVASTVNTPTSFTNISNFKTETGQNRNIKCFTCSASSFSICAAAGSSKTCGRNQVCMLELRKRNQKVIQVHMGCKQRNDCLVQQSQNFMHNNWRYNQCRPTATRGPSVCRACCEKDLCFGSSEETFSFDENTPKSEWRKSFL